MGTTVQLLPIRRIANLPRPMSPRTLIEALERRRVLDGTAVSVLELPTMTIPVGDYLRLRDSTDVGSLATPIVRPAVPTSEVRFEGNLGPERGPRSASWWSIALRGTDGLLHPVDVYFSCNAFAWSSYTCTVYFRSEHLPPWTSISFKFREDGAPFGQFEIYERTIARHLFSYQISPEIWSQRNTYLDIDGDGTPTFVKFNFDTVTDYVDRDATLRVASENGLPAGVLGAVELQGGDLIGTFTNGEKLRLEPDGPLPIVRTFGPRGVVFSRIELSSPAFAIDSPERDAETPII